MRLLQNLKLVMIRMCSGSFGSVGIRMWSILLKDFCKGSVIFMSIWVVKSNQINDCHITFFSVISFGQGVVFNNLSVLWGKLKWLDLIMAWKWIFINLLQWVCFRFKFSKLLHFFNSVWRSIKKCYDFDPNFQNRCIF